MEALGDYIIQRSLGQGAFGAVYLAEHRFIKRSFALKVLPEEICSNAGFMRRFEEQVGEIAALDHPNIAKIHNVSHSDGRYFIVTDPVCDSLGETMNLERYLELKGKSLNEEDWCDLLGQVASALDYAHEAGVVHGAIKLTNILVVAAEKGVRLILSDFGLTRLIGEGISFFRICEQIAKAFMPHLQERAVQQARHFIRSFSFLAPEQKVLIGDAITTKADGYAFGVLTYYLLLQKVPEGCFDLPSRALSEATLNWDFLINRCLQTNPNVRPQKLTQAMQEYLHAPRVISKEMLSLAEVEPKVDNILQMAFEFKKEEVPAAVSAPVQAATIEHEAPKPVLRPQEISRPEYESDPGAIFQRDTLVSHYIPKKVEVKEIDPLLSEMVIVPGGTYIRGSNEGARDEMPRHPVNLLSFALDIHPVTNEQFVRFLQAMGGEKDHNNNDIIRLRDSRIKRSAGKVVIESGYGKHPVVGVTWYGAVAYAKWIGKRLPTEAEWEIAASSGKDIFLYPTGNEIERTQANFFSSDTTPVLSYPPNAFGLYDTAGNVYEWCQDWYAYNYYDSSALEPDNPLGPPQGVYRVLRGGCWKSLKEDLRCSHRHRNNPGAVNGTYGFRCA
ncbi:MAG TPA: bifunctional serine/threonine-protein kinase/formylglycine-generating enzyme family protein, partial [Chlamydiales bacterium]|nr:bifunctional serine/threonine-protein kinase/formylglycine-generating enzyme family protein [Chlamydiales bacterium]